MASNMQITSWERVLAALNFQIPDRVPIDFGGFQSGIHKKAYLETFKPGWANVFNNVHNMQAGVPPENILAMYEAAYEYGVY